MRRRFTLVAALTAVFAFILASPLSADSGFPERINLPLGFRPEGITIGKQATFYVGSVGTGAIFRGNLRTGTGSILVRGAEAPEDRRATGMKLDRFGRLFVSGAGTGEARVYNAQSGALLKTYQLNTSPTFINDVIITRTAAYFTESAFNPANPSSRQVLYRVAIAKDGTLADAAQTIPLTGDIQYVENFNANGIEKARGGKTLIIVQSNTGKLFTVDASTGMTKLIDLGGADVRNGDGLLRNGRTLFVGRNANQHIAVVQLSKNLTSGTLGTPLTGRQGLLDFPTTLDDKGDRLFVVNARFGTQPTPTTEYWVAQLAKPSDGDDEDDDQGRFTVTVGRSALPAVTGAP